MSQHYPDPAEPLASPMPPVPVPAPYWVPPPPPPPGSQPHVGRWIVVAFLVAALAAGGSGVGVGWGIAIAFTCRDRLVERDDVAPGHGWSSARAEGVADCDDGVPHLDA